MPTTVLVLVRDARSLSGGMLLAGRPLRGASSVVAGRKGLRENSVSLVRPPAVMLDNFVCYLAHLTLPTGKVKLMQRPAFSQWRIPELRTHKMLRLRYR